MTFPPNKPEISNTKKKRTQKSLGPTGKLLRREWFVN